jgi:hypothetical protein
MSPAESTRRAGVVGISVARSPDGGNRREAWLIAIQTLAAIIAVVAASRLITVEPRTAMIRGFPEFESSMGDWSITAAFLVVAGLAVLGARRAERLVRGHVGPGQTAVPVGGWAIAGLSAVIATSFVVDLWPGKIGTYLALEQSWVITRIPENTARQIVVIAAAWGCSLLTALCIAQVIRPDVDSQPRWPDAE